MLPADLVNKYEYINRIQVSAMVVWGGKVSSAGGEQMSGHGIDPTALAVGGQFVIASLSCPYIGRPCLRRRYVPITRCCLSGASNLDRFAP